MKIREIIPLQQDMHEGYIGNLAGKIGNKILPSASRDVAKGAWAAAGAIGTNLKQDVGLLLNAGKLAALAAPIYHYNKIMGVYEKQLQDGSITQANYEEHHQLELGYLINEEAGLLAVAFSDIAVSGIAGLFRMFPIIGPILEKFVKVLSKPALGYMYYWINTEEGRITFAQLVGSTYLKNTGSMAEVALDAFKQALATASSIKSEDDLKKLVGMDAKSDKSSAKPDTTTQPVAPATSANTTTKPDTTTQPVVTPSTTAPQPITPNAAADAEDGSIPAQYQSLNRLSRDANGKLQLR
jgi:hypothetical protein